VVATIGGTIAPREVNFGRAEESVTENATMFFEDMPAEPVVGGEMEAPATEPTTAPAAEPTEETAA
jgi:hypothetical protein